jgi:threonine dehydrogenase-like Zn-dependent dehydrogenase
VSVEAYVERARDYFALATQSVKVGGTVCFIRLHENSGIEGLGRNFPTFKRELKVLSAGQFFGTERLRGGRWGEFEVLRDQIATGKLNPSLAVTRQIEFDSVSNLEGITDLFDSLPDSEVKVMLSFPESSAL